MTGNEYIQGRIGRHWIDADPEHKSVNMKRKTEDVMTVHVNQLSLCKPVIHSEPETSPDTTGFHPAPMETAVGINGFR